MFKTLKKEFTQEERNEMGLVYLEIKSELSTSETRSKQTEPAHQPIHMS